MTTKLISTPSLPGDEGRVAELVKEFLSYVGVDKVFIDSYGDVIAVVKGGGLGSVVVEGHLDTVDVGDLKQWSVKPFSGEVIEGRVYGRGAADMKGAIAAQIKALEHVKSLDVDLYYVYTVYEEIAEGVALSQTLKETLRLKPDVVITGEATSLNLGVGHRGRSVVKLSLTGKTAHASMPYEGINALEAAAQAILKVSELNKGLPTHPALGSETAVATLINCSPKVQPQIPDNCEVLVDHRLLPQTKLDDLMKLYSKLCNEVTYLKGVYCEASINKETLKTWRGVELEVVEFFPGWINNDVSMLREVLRSVKASYSNASRHYWKFSTDLVATAGAEGIPSLGLGPGDERMAHKPNEYVEVIELRKAVEIYPRMLKSLNDYVVSKAR